MISKTCATCGKGFQPSGCGTGYGTDWTGAKHCYSCCGDREKASMIETGRATLYFTGDKVTDWPGTLQFRVIESHRIRHNMAREAYAVRFVGPDGFVWSGRNIGDNQILRAKRTKQPA